MGFAKGDEEDVLNIAKRELSEETNIQLKKNAKITNCGDHMAYPQHFWNNKDGHGAIAIRIPWRTKVETKGDALEVLKNPTFFSKRQLNRMIRRGKFFCGLSLTAIRMFEAF